MRTRGHLNAQIINKTTSSHTKLKHIITLLTKPHLHALMRAQESMNEHANTYTHTHTHEHTHTHARAHTHTHKHTHTHVSKEHKDNIGTI